MNMATTPIPVQQGGQAMSPMPAPATDPFQYFRNEMERMFDRFSRGFTLPAFRMGSSIGASVPVADVTEDDKSFKIAVELPGISEKDVEVMLSDDLLTIRGEKKQAEERKEEGYYLAERSYGMFERSFVVPPSVDSSKISANVTNGVLSVVLPKIPEAAPKKIEVKAAA
jgi:HSP20 family protein